MAQTMSWSGKKVLVTGAGGFIGSNLVELLLAQGAQVRAMVRYNSRGTQGWLEEIPLNARGNLKVIQGDLRDAETMIRAVDGQDTVFHLGAMISIPYSYVSPSEANAVNTQGTLNVLNACRQVNVRRLVHTSTSEVYGTALYVPIDEKHPIQGQSPYSASKTGADQLAESFYRTYNLPVVTIRPFNTYGPRQSARAVIPTIITQLINQAELKLGSLTPTRDFTYVTDTARGMLKAAEVDAALGQAINLGVGSEITIGDLVKVIEKVIGTKAVVVSEDQRKRPEKSEVNRLLSDNRLAREVLGWSPEVNLEQGITKSVEWFRKNIQYYTRAQREYVI